MQVNYPLEDGNRETRILLETVIWQQPFFIQSYISSGAQNLRPPSLGEGRSREG
jgi:hypothetical protein